MELRKNLENLKDSLVNNIIFLCLVFTSESEIWVENERSEKTKMWIKFCRKITKDKTRQVVTLKVLFWDIFNHFVSRFQILKVTSRDWRCRVGDKSPRLSVAKVKEILKKWKGEFSSKHSTKLSSRYSSALELMLIMQQQGGEKKSSTSTLVTP